jgi:hypothetical protein
LNTKTYFAISVIAASMIIATVSMTSPVAADKARKGLDTADKNIHDNTGPLSDQDLRFHEGTCQGGHSTTVLDNLGGCDILKEPGGKNP